ncbi:hypothetical protein Tco_0385252, partial [Tanacetum coccineum]
MANLSEDIQCAGFDTRPPMLDKTDFASWQQRIRLYCRGKENGVNILKSIDEGPFQMGTTRVIVAEGTEGSLHLGPERPRVYLILSHYTDAKDIWDNVKMLLEGSELTKEDRESQLFDDFEHFRQNKGETIHDYYVRFAKLINDMRKHPIDDNVKNTVELKVLQHDGTIAIERIRYVGNVYTTRQLYPSCLDVNVVDRNRGQGNNARGTCAAGYGRAQNKVGNANPGQARQDNAVPVVQNNASTVPNDMYVMIDNDLHEPKAQSVFKAPTYTIADNSLNAELAIYKEQVELYERRARFELTEREQKIDEQLRIVICDRFKSERNKYLEEFLDLKALKDKVEDKLFKQGQSIQTVHMMCKPRSYYDEVNKVAIGYKNPLCLHRARQVQPALYSGHVIVTPNHAPAVVRDCEETLEQSEISRKKMHDKMKANECVDNKVNITPPNYSKENFLATFTPQKQLTPEQIFWSQDIVKMKAKALKEQNTRPIKALTVYPPNTPATLVPTVLPTKSQVKINIFTLRQLFSDFEKTYKKRITPTGVTEGERGFEQTKTCYLTEVIPFFKTLQEHFEGIQKALTKEVKEMSDAFDELEAELDQSIVDRKHDAIERKNLLLEHDNIIVDCLLKEVFYVA